MEDIEVKAEFDKHIKEHPTYVICSPGEDLGKNNYLKIEIDPYNVETIKKFLEVETEEEQDNRIRHLLKFLIKNHDELAIERVIEYLKVLGKKTKTLESIHKKIKEKIRTSRQREQTVLKVTNYIFNVELFWKKQPFFYDKSRIWWMWNKKKTKWDIVDETDLMNAIDNGLHLAGETVTRGVKLNYLEAFKRIGRQKKPKEAHKRWIQFKDKAFSLRSRKVYDVTPDYFFTNPIPWSIGESIETPTIDNLFREWVGALFVPTLYEIIAYCCYTDYPIHLAFCFIGAGRNGKTQFQKLLCKFLGQHNITATELDAITNPNNRFESFKLYKKLAGLMGETNFGVLSTSSTFKKLTGGDLIGFEKKNKDPFEDYSYAKLLINSNSLPPSEDTSEGFYRRWLIVDFPNRFGEGKDIINSIPMIEFNNLAKKITMILPELLEKGSFTNQGSIKERRKRYISASNPLPLFIKEYCVEGVNEYVSYSFFYTKYCQYLNKNNKRITSKKEFTKLLNIEGFENRRTSKEGIFDYYIEGLRFKDQITDF